jgi:multidrug resistance efflux pump
MSHLLKKSLTAALALFIALAPCALGEGEAAQSAKGLVRCANPVDIYAPVGGQLLPFDWDVGDTAQPGDALAAVRPRQVLAPNDGVIRSLRAVVGDQAEAVERQFGALCAIDRTGVMWVKADTKKAYNKPENRAITLGETLRVYNGKDSDPLEAEGTVISIDGDDYVVEIPANVFDLEDDVKLYRGTGGAYRSGDRVGDGEVERAALVPVTADGVIAGISASEGQAVKRGDALFTLDEPDTIYTQPASTQALADAQAVIAQLYVKCGQQVQKDQLLMTIEPLNDLEFLVDVDELDILTLKPGDAVEVKVDALNASVPAAVKEIHPLGVTVLDATKYQVSLSMQTVPNGLLPGMRVTAYWGGGAG